MSLLNLHDISVSFGATDVLAAISCTINAGDRIGLVGRNGAGKTTLLRVLAGDMSVARGRRNLARGVSVAYVEQMAPASTSARNVRDEALGVIAGLIDLERELHRAAQALAAAEPGAAEAYARLQHRFEAEGGYTYEGRLDHVLSGLGFDRDDQTVSLSSLSGGQRSRLGLAKALLAGPEVLLMDEPTNHLDFDGLRWLEDFLRRWPGAFVVASHDRYFLDRIATRIWLLEGRDLRSYRGDYSAFEDIRRREIERQEAEHQAQQEFIAKEEAFIRRYRAGQRAREARGRATRLARLERVQRVAQEKDAVVKLAPGARSGEIAVSTKDLVLGYANEPLVTVGDKEVERGARVALVGGNGTGKTTLLRTLAGELEPVAGEVKPGAAVVIAHYWQEAENLDPASTVLEDLLRDGRLKIQEARDLLGLMLFSGDDVFKPVSGLSGGERSRLALAKLTTSRANLLLLDEPTNHLDIPAREGLEVALTAYPGTVVFASHDRRLMSRLATRLWIVEGRELRAFDGTFDEYQSSLERPAVAVSPQEASASPRPAPAPVRRELSAYRRRQERARLETAVAEAESELAEAEELITAASDLGDSQAVGELGRRFEVLKSRLEGLLAEWLELEDHA